MATEMKTIEGITRQIETLSRVVGEIRSCRDIGQIKKVADFAAMVKLASKRVGASVEVQNEAAEASIKARHWEGTLLREMASNGARRARGQRSRNGTSDSDASPDENGQSHDGIAGPDTNQNQTSHDATSGSNANPNENAWSHEVPSSTPTLAELGISKDESSRAQAIAELSEEKLSEVIEAVKKDGKELTATEVIKAGRSAKAAKSNGSSPGRKKTKDAGLSAYKAWEELIKQHYRLVESIRNSGGLKAMVKDWEMADQEQFLEDFSAMIEEMRVLREDLRKAINSSR